MLYIVVVGAVLVFCTDHSGKVSHKALRVGSRIGALLKPR